MAAENITYMVMNDSLYRAAARGEIEEFKNYKVTQLESLLTPNRNNVLHVNMATEACIGFTEHILNECPSLLLQANAQGRTPLHIAARHGHSDIVKFLITFQAKRADQGDLEQQETASEAVRRMLRMKDLKSDTALHVAARYGHVGVVQELVEFEDPDYSYSVNKNQETPVYIAARRGDGGLLVTKILDKLKSTAHGGPKGRTALHAAAMSGNAEETRAILEKIGGKVTKETDEKGHTPLHYAAHLGHISVVEELLKWDKSAAYIADTKSQMTPLLMAARQGYVVMVRRILSFCPDCWEIFDQRGWNFLHFLAFRERVNFDFNDTVGRKFNLNDVKTEYGFGRDLFDAKDESGITPRQVDGARHPPRYFSAYFSSTNQGREEKEQIMKLLEAILKEQVADVAVRPSPILDQEKEMEKVKGSHMVVATLIATMTFAAAIAVPGGYKSDEGPDQGAPFLLHDAAFIVFVVSDGLAFFSSMFAIILHFRTFASGIHVIDVMLASGAIVYSLTALMIAFYTGVFAILRPSMVLAIFSLCLGLIIHVVILLEQNMKMLEKILKEQVADVAVRPSSILDQEKEMEKVKGSHMVVATLIATVTFAAGIAVPGGYKSDKGPDQGTPFLLHDAAFIVFVVSDGLAFFSSMFSVILHFRTFASGIHVFDVILAAGVIVYSLATLVIAFYTGVFAILRPSLGLAIFSLCLGLIIHVVILLVNVPVLISFIVREFPLPF